jgi:hypothetical protein
MRPGDDGDEAMGNHRLLFARPARKQQVFPSAEEE